MRKIELMGPWTLWRIYAMGPWVHAWMKTFSIYYTIEIEIDKMQNISPSKTLEPEKIIIY